MSKTDFDKISARVEGLGVGRSKRRCSPKKTTLYTRLDLSRSLINTRMLIAVLISMMMLSPVTFQVCGEGTNCSCGQSCCGHPIMRPSLETLHNWFDCYNRAPYASIDLDIEPLTGQFSLLNHLNYVPSERDQGYCGNCWAWAGTGVLGIALDVQTGVFDRLSVQYLNSKYNGGTAGNWACCGGWLADLADFYSNEGFAIPWSNTNAAWADWDQNCENGTSVPWETISTEPNYTITECTVKSIETHGVVQETAITNIKNVLAQNKAVWFAYVLPTGDDWNQFFSFWDEQPETAIWNPDYSCGHYWDENGGGHAVLCVGYNDEDPENAYWITVNSWGTTASRPNGIFHLNMNMNYSCYFEDYEGLWYSLYWQTLDTAFSVVSPNPVASFTYSPRDPFASETVTFDASTSYSLSEAIVSYVWDFGDNKTGVGEVTEHIYVSSGAYQVTLTVTDDKGLNATCIVEVNVQRPTVNVQVRVGAIHFRSETVDFHVLVSRLGETVDANLTATLYHNGELYENLTPLIENVVTGFYRIPYIIPSSASEGTYVLIVKAEYLSFNGVSFGNFLLSSTLTGWNALLVDVNSTVGTLKTDLGLIELRLDAVNATVVNIENETAILNSNMGLITSDLDVINAKVTTINNTVATIQTDFGSIQLDVNAINAHVAAINETTATIQTTLGVLEGNVTSIKENIATIDTDIGTIKLQIDPIASKQQSHFYMLLLLIIITVAGIVVLKLAPARSFNKKKDEEN